MLTRPYVWRRIPWWQLLWESQHVHPLEVIAVLGVYPYLLWKIIEAWLRGWM